MIDHVDGWMNGWMYGQVGACIIKASGATGCWATLLVKLEKSGAVRDPSCNKLIYPLLWYIFGFTWWYNVMWLANEQKSNLVLKSDEGGAVLRVLALLGLQINWGTLNNLVINSPLERLSYYLTWQIDPSSGIWLPPSLSGTLSALCCLFFWTTLSSVLLPPSLLLPAKSGNRDAPGAFAQISIRDWPWWDHWVWLSWASIMCQGMAAGP